RGAGAGAARQAQMVEILGDLLAVLGIAVVLAAVHRHELGPGEQALQAEDHQAIALLIVVHITALLAVFALAHLALAVGLAAAVILVGSGRAVVGFLRQRVQP